MLVRAEYISFALMNKLIHSRASLKLMGYVGSRPGAPAGIIARRDIGAHNSLHLTHTYWRNNQLSAIWT